MIGRCAPSEPYRLAPQGLADSAVAVAIAGLDVSEELRAVADPCHTIRRLLALGKYRVIDRPADMERER